MRSPNVKVSSSQGIVILVELGEMCVQKNICFEGNNLHAECTIGHPEVP